MSRKVTALSLLAIFLLSAYSITVFLKPGDIFSSTPIYTDDYAMHFSQCLSTKRFLLSAGKCWGYDPFFLAGYPRGALVNADNKAWELLFVIFSPLSEGVAFKLYLILFLLLYPFFLYAAARNFNLSREVSVIAAVLAMLFFHLSIAIDFISWGMVSYVFASYLSIYLFSLLYAVFEHFTWKRYITLTLLASLSLLMHILSPVHLFIPVLILYALTCKNLPLSRHLLFALMIAVILAVNSFWLIPLVQFFQEKSVRPEHYGLGLQIYNIFEAITVYIQQNQSILYRKTPQLNNTFMEVMLLLFSLGGFLFWWREKRYKLVFSFLGGSLVIFAIAYFGSHAGFFAQLQPQRFIVPLNLLLIVPASIGIYCTLQPLFKGKGLPAICFICSLIFAVLVGPVAKPLKAIYGYDLYRLSCAFPPPLTELFTWLENHTTREGRILIEDSECDTEHQYYGAHFPALFPEYVKREYLCGPRPMYPIKHGYASFTAGSLFAKQIEDYSLEELKHYFDIYNVKWIVCWLGTSKDVLEQYPALLARRAEIDKFTIYEVNRAPSFFLRGRGSVLAEYNRLQLSNIIPEKGEITIAYHWMETLKTIPALQMERTFLADDPVGFITIKDVPESLVIINDY